MMRFDDEPVAAAVPSAPHSEWFASYGRFEPDSTVGSSFRVEDFRVPTHVDRRDVLQFHAYDSELGSLPSLAETDECRVVFDGTLYNRADLIDQLAPGHATLSDAEIVLRAYLHWGELVVHEIRGIFALIVWDATDDALICARDPLGAYPLFYAQRASGLLISTSCDVLVNQPGISSALNRAALADHLCSRWPVLGETFYAACQRLPSGHILRLDRSGIRVRRYWDPTPNGNEERWIDDGVAERFEFLFTQAVNRALTFGRPGVYLSGGLDSISVAAMAMDQCRAWGMQDPVALSLSFPDPQCNEETIQRGVANDLGMPQYIVPLHRAIPKPELFMSALEVSGSMSAPLVTPWLPAYLHLAMEGKRRGCDVILTGGGGDEWLTVTPLLAADLIRNRDAAGLNRLCRSLMASYRLSRAQVLRSTLWRFGARPVVGAMTRSVIGKTSPELLKRRVRRSASRSTPRWVAPESALRRQLIDRAANSWTIMRPTDSFYWNDIRKFLDHPLTSMEMEEHFEIGKRVGLRIMMPYWDPDLADLLCRTPPDLLQEGGRSKALVRGMLARRFPQLGFEHQRKVVSTGFFRAEILSGAASAWESMQGAGHLAELGIIDADLFQTTVESTLASNNAEEAPWIWEVLNLEAWVRSRVG